ncbi:MAG: hypothetical protein IIB66_03325 [Proteobacteria bacterium]|nr:hypothetical protein [Pseudomonadota bacterium]
MADPADAPDEVFTADVVSSVEEAFSDDFEIDTGWTVLGNPLTGAWERAVPQGSGGGRGDPLTDFDGSGQCFVTGNGFDEDVDEGPVPQESSVQRGQPIVVQGRVSPKVLLDDAITRYMLGQVSRHRAPDSGDAWVSGGQGGRKKPVDEHQVYPIVLPWGQPPQVLRAYAQIGVQLQGYGELGGRQGPDAGVFPPFIAPPGGGEPQLLELGPGGVTQLPSPTGNVSVETLGQGNETVGVGLEFGGGLGHRFWASGTPLGVGIYQVWQVRLFLGVF